MVAGGVSFSRYSLDTEPPTPKYGKYRNNPTPPVCGLYSVCKVIRNIHPPPTKAVLGVFVAARHAASCLLTYLLASCLPAAAACETPSSPRQKKQGISIRYGAAIRLVAVWVKPIGYGSRPRWLV